VIRKLTLDPTKPKAFTFRANGKFWGVLYPNGKLVARVDHVNGPGCSGLRTFSDWKIYIRHCFQSDVMPDVKDPQGQLSVMLGLVSQLSWSRVSALRTRLAKIKKFTKDDKRRLFNHGKERS